MSADDPERVARFYRNLAALVDTEGGLYVIGEDLSTDYLRVVEDLQALANGYEQKVAQG